MAYKSKYRITNDTSLKGYEVRKIMDGVDKETKKQEFWNMVTSCLLIALVLFVIMIIGAQ